MINLYGPVVSPKAVIWVWRVVAVLVLVLLGLALANVCNADQGSILTQPVALTELVRLHNAGLLLDLTLSSEQYTGELLPDSSWKFKLEDGWKPRLDGFARFVRRGRGLQAVQFVPPGCVLGRVAERAGIENGADHAALFQTASILAVSRTFAGAVCPNVRPDDWRLAVAASALSLGRAAVLLRSGERRISLLLVSVRREGQWRLEVAGFHLEEVRSQPRLE